MLECQKQFGELFLMKDCKMREQFAVKKKLFEFLHNIQPPLRKSCLIGVIRQGVLYTKIIHFSRAFTKIAVRRFVNLQPCIYIFLKSIVFSVILCYNTLAKQT